MRRKSQVSPTPVANWSRMLSSSSTLSATEEDEICDFVTRKMQSADREKKDWMLLGMTANNVFSRVSGRFYRSNIIRSIEQP